MSDFAQTCAGIVDFAIGCHYSNDPQSFDRWLEQLTSQICSLVTDDRMDDEMIIAALSACSGLLELEIPHEGHIKSVIWIRLVLAPDMPIEDYQDWPFDIGPYVVRWRSQLSMIISLIIQMTLLVMTFKHDGVL